MTEQARRLLSTLSFAAIILFTILDAPFGFVARAQTRPPAAPTNVRITNSPTSSFAISGTVTPSTSGSGVTIALSGAATASTVTDASGNFRFSGLANGSYVLTPSRSGSTFSPPSQNVTVNNADVANVNFTVSTSTGTVLFFDDFTGTTLDPAWIALNRQGDQNNGEVQCYTPANVSVANGFVTQTARAQTSTCSGRTWNYTSSMIQWRTFNFTYGTVEFRAKMAGGQGTWPAIWMLGANCQQTNVTAADNNPPCNWPQPGSDEIDITEINHGNMTIVSQNVISGNSGFQSCGPSTSDVSQNFHTYTLVWGPGSLVFKIDGVQTCRFTNNIPSTPMFLMINIAMGGTNGGTINNATLPQTQMVDYVKVTR